MTNKGFTLIEVIVSVGILGIISIMFVTVFAKALEVNLANIKINKASVQSATNVTNNNITCEATPSVVLKFGEDIFQSPAQATICKSSSAPNYKLFRVMVEPGE